MRDDSSIHKICILAIKKSLMDTAELSFTSIYENRDSKLPFQLGLNFSELPICSTIKDSDNWSILTTQRLLSKINSVFTEANMETAQNRYYGDFKGYKSEQFTLGKVENSIGEEIEYLIETGKSSMVMVQGVKKRILIQQNQKGSQTNKE